MLADAVLDDATRLHRLQGPGPLATLRVQSWARQESLDRPWRMEVNALGTDATLAPADLIGLPLTLVTRLADGSDCPRRGLVTEAHADEADGGLARYHLVVEPALALLAQGLHSRVWQEQTVVDIVESILRPYAAQLAWRWADCTGPYLADSAQAGLRSYTVQYRETDLDFLERILAREGLAYAFEAGEDASLGECLVIFADSVDASTCPEDPISAAAAQGVRYTGQGAEQAQDAVTVFGAERQLPVAQVATLSWDYRAKAAIATVVPTAAEYAGADAPWLEDYDTPGAYAWPDAAQAERTATLMQQAHELGHKRWLGRGTVRSFAAGTHFRLADSDLDLLDSLGGSPEDRRLLLTAVTHAGINNLDLNTAGRAHSEAEAERLPGWVDPAVKAQAAATGYGNAFEAQRASVPWRPRREDGTGARRHPHPTASGPLTATVVGPDGQACASGAQEIHTDALGRVRIAFDFQQQYPGEGRSPASTWVRVLQRWAGPGMGAQWVPRIGQEVLVDFVEGDIERPLVVGALYNGRGEAGNPPTPGGQGAQADTTALAQSTDDTPAAQGNLTGGNAPAWHGAGAGALSAEGQANAAALSGYRSKEFGGWGYNHLVFDDTDTQLRVQMHSSQHASQLSLGHLIHQADNHRGSFRGLGFELRTDAYGAVRGNQGLLISSYAAGQAEPAGDNAAGIALQGQLVQLAQTLSQAASSHQSVALAAHLGADAANASTLSATEGPAKALHTVLKGMVDAHSLDAAQQDAQARNTATSDGKLPHTGAPIVAIEARAGLAATAGQDLHWSAAESIVIASGQDTHLATAGASRVHTGQAIGILGGAIQPGEQAQGTGLSLIAAQGDIDLEAQAGPVQIAAKNDVAIQSAQTHIDWAAAKRIVLQTAGGASVTIAAEGLTVECPGKITVNASQKSFSGPQHTSAAIQSLPHGDIQLDQEFVLYLDNGDPAPSRQYEIQFADGGIVQGATDGAGRTGLKKAAFPERYRIRVLPPQGS